MNKLNLFTLLLMISAFLFPINCVIGQVKFEVKTHTGQNGYKYETVTNDPLGVRIYTLANGLKVYLSVNKDEPRIQTYIPIKAGSTYDPAETTGLAHYLEHMMFKGTSKIATSDWKKEKVLLQQISDLYEKHRNTNDTTKKKEIYAKIDSVSGIAATYSIANEYDKLVGSLGTKGTNAHTWYERTVYINNIPSNELGKWLELEKERFGELVLRLFHTELEAVYEEFNMSQDNDGRKQYTALVSSLFPTHPYGTQTTLGKADHLKNPSMVNIHNYWNTYYVPNNIAICMAGDLDFDETISLIDKTFGTFKRKNVPKITHPKEKPITKPIIKEVFGPDKESLNFAFRFAGDNSNDQKIVTIIDMLLNNSKAGLIDLNLVQQQKVMSAGCSPSFYKDYGMHTFHGSPREGQTLEQVLELVLNEIEKIKNGEFDDWLIKAVINDLRLNEIRSQEINSVAYKYVDAFLKDISWADRVKFLDELEKITKDQIIDFAKKHYSNNYVVVYKRTGKDKDATKVDKPTITPVAVNRDKQSDYLKNFMAWPSDKLKSVFIDFEKEITKTKNNSGIEINYLHNSTNELFTLAYIIDMGKDHDIKLPIAVNYLPYLGTDKYTAAQLQQEFYKLGVSIGVQTSSDRSYVYISGLKKSFEQGLKLLEHVLSNVKPDQQALDAYIDGILKKRIDAKLNKRIILNSAMRNYGTYGSKSPFTRNLSKKELKELNADELAKIIRDIYSYKHRLFYYGQRELSDVELQVDKYHKIPKTLKDYPVPVEFTELDFIKNKVYFVDYDMIQTQIIMMSKDEIFNKSLMPEAQLYGEYYGFGLSSIVFQEIRESKALAYSAGSWYSVPDKPTKSHYINAFVATQANKLKDATDALIGLMNNMAKSDKQFIAARDAITKKIETERITKSAIFWTYQNNLDKGINYDIRKDTYNKMQNITIDEFNKFFDKHVKDKKYTFLILGSKKSLDMEILKQLGELQELTLEEIFNY